MIDPNQLQRVDDLLNQIGDDAEYIRQKADRTSQAVDDAYHQYANGATRESGLWSDLPAQANQHATNKS